MEKSRKNLRIMSICLLAFTLLSFVRFALAIFFTDWKDKVSAPEISAKAAFIITLVFGVALTVLEAYVAVKGIKVSKNPDSSKGYITLSKVLLVLSVIALITPISSIIQTGEIKNNIIEMTNIVLDVMIYLSFIKYANEVRVA